MKKTFLTVSFLSCALILLSLSFPFHKASAQREEERFVPGRVLVKFRDNVGLDHARQIVAALGAREAGELPGIGVMVLDLPEQADEAGFAHALAARGDVAFAERDRILKPADITPNDPWFVNWEWHLRKIAAPTAWSTTTGKATIVIAILDMGVNGNHEDLSSKMVPGWNVYNNTSDTSDVAGHGTTVAGTAASISNNGTGVASVCWGCKIMPVRISDSTGSATYSSIANGLTWAADHGARVANVSYAPLNNSSVVTTAANYFRSKGGVVTVAAGNEGTFDSSANNPSMLTVTATDSFDQLYAWSNTGNSIDLCAPGNVYTTDMSGGYVAAAGTSYSAPIVAGVAGLLFSINPNLTANQVENILTSSADDLGPVGPDSSFGFGRINAAKAVAMASGTASIDTTVPSVAITSPQVNSAVSGSISASVQATDNVGVASVTLRVDGVVVGTDTAAPYTFVLDTTQLAGGAHTITANATDAAGNIGSTSISVNVVTDTVSPTVNIISPGEASKVSGNVNVLASATDNISVSRVEFYIDDALQATSTASPFSMTWNTRKAKAGTHTLQCKAFDPSGNLAWSPAVHVSK